MSQKEMLDKVLAFKLLYLAGIAILGGVVAHILENKIKNLLSRILTFLFGGIVSLSVAVALGAPDSWEVIWFIGGGIIFEPTYPAIRQILSDTVINFAKTRAERFNIVNSNQPVETKKDSKEPD
jgi:hypothetical protein